MLTKFDTRFSVTVLLGDLSFSRSFAISHYHKNLLLTLAQHNVTFPLYCNQKKIRISINTFYLSIKVHHFYSSDDTFLKNDHFFGNTVFRITWRSSIRIRFVARCGFWSYKINIFRRFIYNFCCISLCVVLIRYFYSCRCSFFNDDLTLFLILYRVILVILSVRAPASMQSQNLYFPHFFESVPGYDNFPVRM